MWLKQVNWLIKKIPSVYQFCNGELNKFLLLLRKGIYPYEYMDSWENFKLGLSRLSKTFSNQCFSQPCSKKYHHLFVWC